MTTTPADTGPGQRHSVELGVFCNTCHVEWRGNFLVADGMSPADQITMVRAHVRSLGWQSEEPRDFCPEHKPIAPAVTEGQTTETAWVLETLWRNGEWRRHHPARATRYDAEQDYERSVYQDATREYRIVRVETTTTVEPAPATKEPELTGTRQCGHDDYHDAHAWADHPHICCPGHSLTEETGQ